MKRHQSRLAPTVLTLSLLGAASLLTACGGGGGGDDPAAAPPSAESKPVEVVKPPATVNDFSSADEPYFVAESSVRTNIGVAGKETGVYRLNIMDGRSRLALSGGTFESTAPFTNKWTVIQKFKRTLQEFKENVTVEGKTKEVLVGRQFVEQLLGNGTLVFIRKDSDKNRVFEVDLSRTSDLKPVRISSIDDACTVTGSHLINRDGSEAAVYITSAGKDGLCGDASSKDAAIKKAAEDNILQIVKTGTKTEAERAKQYTPLVEPKNVLRQIFKNGVMTGALIQQGSGDDTKLAVLSPTLSEVLNTSNIKIGTTETFSTSPDDKKLGVEWIADAPGEVGGGYIRLQQFNFSTNGYTNLLYSFNWDADKKVATTSETPMTGMAGGAITNKGINDHRYIYFVDGDVVYYGPTADPKDPFQSLTRLEKLAGKTDTVNAYVSDQTIDQIVVRSEGGVDAVFAVPKNPLSTTLTTVTIFDNADSRLKPQTPVGIWYQVNGNVNTPYLITKQRSEFDDIDPNSYSLKRTPLTAGQEYAEFMNEVNRINILSPVWNTTTVNGQRTLMSAIVCPKTLASKGNCSSTGDDMKTVNFDKKSFGVALGKVVTTNGQDATVKAGDVYHGINANIVVSRKVKGGLDQYEDPWFFNSQLAGSLLSVVTPFTPTAK